MSVWFTVLIQVGLLGYAVVGGVFLAFSDFIMRSLARTDGAGGVSAMQVINTEVFRWIFMALFLGLTPVSLLVAGFGVTMMPSPAGPLLALSGLVYLVGCFGVTVVFNVPMNEALAKMDPATKTAANYWQQMYLPRWTFWNSVRATACIGAAALQLIAVCLMLKSGFL